MLGFTARVMTPSSPIWGWMSRTMPTGTISGVIWLVAMAPPAAVPGVIWLLGRA